MKKIFTCTAVVAVMLSVTGCGRRGAPIYNVNRHVMPLEAENLNDKQRSERIRLAASKSGWSCRETDPQKLICRLQSKKHTATVDIDHNKHYFSVNYLDSSGLRHKKGRIHSRYNKWIMKLEKAIEANIAIVKLGQSGSTSTAGTGADTPVANASRYHHTKKTIIEETRSSNAGRDERYDSGQYDDKEEARRAADAERANQERTNQERLAAAKEHRDQLARDARATNERLSAEHAERDRLAREVAAHNNAEREQLAKERVDLERRRAEAAKRTQDDAARHTTHADKNASSVKEAPIGGGNVDHVDLEW